MADPDRKGGRGLSLRTLAIASAASLSAAMVTSRLFPPGTIYASALTPVIVAAVSEMLSRPADRVSELRRQRRTLVMESRVLDHARSRGEQESPLAGAPEFAQGLDADAVLGGNGRGQPAPIRIHGRRRGIRRVLHPKVWLATGLVAFVVAVAALTLPELIFGGAVTTSDRTTFFGGSTGNSSSQTTPTTTSTTPTQTTTETTTTLTQTVPAQTPTDTSTGTATTPTGTSTAPSGGTPAPAGTGTTTTPSGVMPKAP